MKKIQDWDNVSEAKDGGFNLPKGGYVCRVVSVSDDPENEFLQIEFDIANGEYAGYYMKLFNKHGWWLGNFRRYYRESSVSYFKAFINAIEKSNEGFKWNWDEQVLKDKFVGLILQEEEYVSNKDNKLKVKLSVAAIRSTDAILSGDYEVPEIKKLQDSNKSAKNISNKSFGGDVLPDEDIPF